MTKRAMAMAVVALSGGAIGCPMPGTPGIDSPPAVSGRLASAASLDPRIQEGALEPVRALPPITGGTLHVASGNVLAVSDPLRDRVVLVDLVASRVIGEVALPEGAFPARSTHDDEGRVHVVLRGLGEVLTVDPRDLAGARRVEVCGAPRGIAYDEEAGLLRVGCQDGTLDSLSTDGELVSRIQLGVDDIRDILPIGGRLAVTTFRSAEVHLFDGELRPLSTVAPSERTDTASFSGETVRFLPEVAWSTVVVGNSLYMVHQRGAERVVAAPTTPAYYGNGFSCSTSVLDSVVTRFDLSGDGESMRQGDHFSVQSATLPVDLGVAANGDVIMVAAAEQGSLPSALRVPAGVFARGGFSDPNCDLVFGETPERENGGAIAVAIDERGRTILQLRDPAAVVIDGVTLPLGGEERFDSGHALFHGNAGLGLACASCHPEGGDDGRVWEFPGFPPLRTPAMHGGMAGTAPFHWEGDMPTMGALMNEVFERRMGGPRMGVREENALAGWVDALPTSVPREGLDAASVDRGARLFYGEAECGSCHVGEMLTDNRSYDVGTGMTLQVPSLVGVSYRLPVMHNGCADTLEERFDPSCGGGRHGRTNHLAPEQISDLVAFLQTL